MLTQHTINPTTMNTHAKTGISQIKIYPVKINRSPVRISANKANAIQAHKGLPKINKATINPFTGLDNFFSFTGCVLKI